MADQSDVEGALVAQCALALGLGSGYQAGAFGTANTGDTVTVYRGWPTDTRLYQDVLAGKSHLSVYAEQGMVRNTTRWWPTRTLQAAVTPTLTATVVGSTVVIGGTVTAGNVVGIRNGSVVGGQVYAVTAAANDTPTTVATALAAKISGATVVGTTITVPNVRGMLTGTMAPQPVLREVRRQEQGFRLVFWAPTPAARDALASAVDSALAALTDTAGNLTEFVTVKTGEMARVRYRTTYSDDMTSRDRVWRRDLCYAVEYPTTAIEQDPTMLFGGGTTTTGGISRPLGDAAPH